MIQVLKRGARPGDEIFDATCGNCKSDLRFHRSDAVFVTHPHGDYLSIQCPVCTENVTALASTGRPAPPRAQED